MRVRSNRSCLSCSKPNNYKYSLLVRNLNQKCTHVGTTTNNIKLVRAIICAQAIFKHPTAEGHIFHVAVCKRLSKMSFCSKKKPEFHLQTRGFSRCIGGQNLWRRPASGRRLFFAQANNTHNARTTNNATAKRSHLFSTAGGRQTCMF